jgi:type III restriction enzyme
VTYLNNPEIRAAIVKEVTSLCPPAQLTINGIGQLPDIAKIVAMTTDLVAKQTIDIPRVLVVPKAEVKSGFRPFKLRLDTLKYPAVSEELWVQHLRTNRLEVVAAGRGGIEEARLDDYVVSGLVDFDDISYDDHSELLYDLATQTVKHFRAYLSEDDTAKVLRCYQRDIARFIHSQMQEHYWEDEVGYDVRISKGFTELKSSAYTAVAGESPVDYRSALDNKSDIGTYLFSGFQRCLYAVQKFQTDPERKLAVILDRDALRWLRPARGQFQIFYKAGADHLEYQPDFVAETTDKIYMIETKARNELNSSEVQAKTNAAVRWCNHASNHAAGYKGRQWQYVLIPHDAVRENMTLAGLVERYKVQDE